MQVKQNARKVLEAKLSLGTSISLINSFIVCLFDSLSLSNDLLSCHHHRIIEESPHTKMPLLPPVVKVWTPMSSDLETNGYKTSLLHVSYVMLCSWMDCSVNDYLLYGKERVFMY